MPSSPATAALYLETGEAVADFLGAASGAQALAVDTEGASFHRFVDRIYLLQLSTPNRSAVIDPLSAGPMPALGALLESRDVEKVFHDADYDLRLLHQDYGWNVRNVFDTRIAAQLLGLTAFGLAALLERYFEVRLDKKHQRADWSMRPLPRAMLDYAAQDTMHLLGLRARLHEELEGLGRWPWAREEFERLEGTRWPDEDPGEAFLRVKGARDLTRRQLALLRELVIWRDGVALGLDRATFRVIGNEVLLEIARTAPHTREALGSIKGTPRALMEQRGEEVLDAVRRGEAVPEADLPRFPRAPRWNRQPDFDDIVGRLKAVRDAAAQRLHLDPGVLCARDRLEAVARARPAGMEELARVPELRRWQVAELGEGFVRALRAVSAPAAPPANASPYRDG